MREPGTAPERLRLGASLSFKLRFEGAATRDLVCERRAQDRNLMSDPRSDIDLGRARDWANSGNGTGWGHAWTNGRGSRTWIPEGWIV